MEHGIDLLIAGSPISEHTVIDTEILDYESDDQSLLNVGPLAAAVEQSSAMDTSNTEKDRTAGCSSTEHLNATYSLLPGPGQKPRPV
jgi:hypothetical protein